MNIIKPMYAMQMILPVSKKKVGIIMTKFFEQKETIDTFDTK